MAPLKPELQFLRLPPILRIMRSSTKSAYSKGSRGLSVLVRVRGIFTTTTISPGHWLRQRFSHYAFHAGRNLPDKELRYLRTLKVRAAVYWGFGRELHHYWLTRFLNLPAPGRRQTAYIHFRVSAVLCF